jgi:hypothetical protein
MKDWHQLTKRGFRQAKTSVVVTHMNEFQSPELMNALKYSPNKAYISTDESTIQEKNFEY